MKVAYLQDYKFVNEDTKHIVDAINKSGRVSADKIEGMQKSVSELAVSVHELATSNKYLSKDIDSVKREIKVLDSRLDKIEPAAESMREIKTIFLRWIIPIMLMGSFGGGIAYVLLK